MRVAIIEDNEIDRLNLCALLGDHPQLHIAGAATSLEAAVALIEKEKPEAVFLDIHLGRQRGFQALAGISYQPLVVITTSHPHYALQGIDVEAVDYLLKPVEETTLARAVRRLQARAGLPAADIAGRLDPRDVQVFKQPDSLHVVPVEQILAITGERVYSRVLVLDGREYLHNRPLREWRNLLPPQLFKALDRSTILNIREVKSIETEPGLSGYVVTFRKGVGTLHLGEAAMKALRDLL